MDRWNLCRRKAKAFFATGERWSVKRRSSRFVYLRSVIYDRPLSVVPSAASGDTVIPFTHGLCQSIPATIMAPFKQSRTSCSGLLFRPYSSASSRNVSIAKSNWTGDVPTGESLFPTRYSHGLTYQTSHSTDEGTDSLFSRVDGVKSVFSCFKLEFA